MTVTSLERARMILTTLNYGLVVTEFDATQHIEWLNQEEVLSTMKSIMGRGMDKGKVLRKALDNLTDLGYLEKREPKTRKTQARWEYRISEKGKVWLKDLRDISSVM